MKKVNWLILVAGLTLVGFSCWEGMSGEDWGWFLLVGVLFTIAGVSGLRKLEEKEKGGNREKS